MSIHLKFFAAFSALVALALALAAFGFRDVSESGDRVVQLYDGPLMAVNHSRSAHATFNDIGHILSSDPNPASVHRFKTRLADLSGDLDVVQQRVLNSDVTTSLTNARFRVSDWSESTLSILDSPLAGLISVPASFVIERKRADAVAALDDLVEVVAAYGFEYRTNAEATVKRSRVTLLVISIGTALAGLVLAFGFSRSMSRPIVASVKFAERIAAGILTNQIDVNRSDEIGRLQQSLLNMQGSLKKRADTDREMMERVVFLAHYDHLTNLCNRARFTQALNESILQLHKPNTNFSVLVLDLNKFKNVNDTLGHPLGDELLRQVAGRLKASVRETDVVARLGGDEFAILQFAGTCDQREAAIALSLRIEQLLSEPFDLSGNTVNIGTSIGISLAPEHGRIASELLRKADLALYEAKADSGSAFAFFAASMMVAVDSRRLLELELRSAIDFSEFELHYQPVVDAKSHQVCAVEALVRWRHPTRGLVSPDQFIPLAEETGLIVQMGEWILQRACADAVTWPDEITVAVNLSAVQFKRSDLFDVILCALVESGLKPGRLELEITETMLLENEQEFLTTIRQLKNVGVTVALDDFGTGYSSLSYLTKFPFDKIKIDRSFTQGMGKRADCDAVISSVLTLARGLDIAITAEGVETEQQADLLRDAGVDLLQGYLFGRPVECHDLRFGVGRPVAGYNVQTKEPDRIALRLSAALRS